MKSRNKVLVTGGSGMLGRTLKAHLSEGQIKNCLFEDSVFLDSKTLDLTDQKQTLDYFKYHKFNAVIHLASKVGGIQANIDNPIDFLHLNTMIHHNTIMAAHQSQVPHFIFIGSSCIYPRHCFQPMKEEHLLSGPLEPTNEGYALSKISGLKLVEYINKSEDRHYMTLLPPNLYGPFDHFNKDTSHVISALISRFHEAHINQKNEVTIWGDGSARREFLFTEDFCEAIVLGLEQIQNLSKKKSFYNVGTSQDISIHDLAILIAQIVGFKGQIRFDSSRPNGMPQKLLASDSFLKMGWKARTSLEVGLHKTYSWYKGQSI